MPTSPPPLNPEGTRFVCPLLRMDWLNCKAKFDCEIDLINQDCPETEERGDLLSLFTAPDNKNRVDRLKVWVRGKEFKWEVNVRLQMSAKFKLASNVGVNCLVDNCLKIQIRIICQMTNV